MNITFKGTVRKKGETYTVTIPIVYIEEGIVEKEKEYRFRVEEVKDD